MSFNGLSDFFFMPDILSEYTIDYLFSNWKILFILWIMIKAEIKYMD